MPDEVDPYVQSPVLDNDANLKVSALINPITNDWDREQLSNIFMQRDIDLILRIPLSMQYEDESCWRGDFRGVYTVRNGYRLLTNVQGISESIIWRGIWKLKIPPNIRNFLWRCFQHVIPTLLALSFPGLDIETDCPLCRQSPESLKHLMCDCIQVAPLWHGLEDCPLPGLDDEFNAWLAGVITSGNQLAILKCIALCWCIWRGRNEVVWNNKVWNVSHIKNEAANLLHAWQDVSFEPHEVPNLPMTEPDILFIPEGGVHFFVDAAVFPNEGKPFSGVVITDKDGVFLGAKNGPLRSLGDAHLAEAPLRKLYLG